MSRFFLALAGAVMAGACLAACGGVAAESVPLPEHPRPDWERADWVNLNGPWEFGFTKGVYDQRILVPFSWAAPLSGVRGKGDNGHYRREIEIPSAWAGKRVFVVVGASDLRTTAYLDGERINTFEGGYLPLEFELTPRAKPGERHLLAFDVWDPEDAAARKTPYLLGKQSYGNARGIWQTVYLEARGEAYFDYVHFSPDLATSTVAAEICLDAPARRPLVARLALDGKTHDVSFAPGEAVKTVRVKLERPHLWTLEDPYLYDVTLSLPSDLVHTYFGFRSVEAGKNPWNGHPYVLLNGKPVYLRLTLDQCYHPEGYYTFPSDDFARNEILIGKRLGLNGHRLHMKVEIPRKLYWADRLGMLLMTDVPAAWGPASDMQFNNVRSCLEGMVRRDFNHPSVFSYVLFNESWGLFTDGDNLGPRRRLGTYAPWVKRKVAELYRHAKALDPTRLVEDNSPCLNDHVVTDVNSWHGYHPGYYWEHVVSEFCDWTEVGRTNNYAGGFVQTGAPMMNSECGDVWGYKGGTGDSDIAWNYHLIMNAFRRHPKCCGWVSTEHHDAVNEWRGYVRYDRTAKEFGFGEIFPGMTIADLHGDAYLPLDEALCRTFEPGATFAIPVDVSLVTDRFAGSQAALTYFLHYHDGEGREVRTDPVTVPLRDPELRPWRSDRLADVCVRLPDVEACGAVCFTLAEAGRPIARNFQCFVTRAGERPPVRPSKASWSLKTWEVLGGLKQCGAGKGFFEYEFPAPDGACAFRAEESSKRLDVKDLAGAAAGTSERECMAGGGGSQRSRNPNSYPQTSAVYKLKGAVAVFANGVKVKTMELPDDPADHRGILSWHAQPQAGVDGYRNRWPRVDSLYDAGSYGYLLEAEIPAEAVRASRDGKLTIRLEAEKNGLAVYGRAFGRYPLDPHITR